MDLRAAPITAVINPPTAYIFESGTFFQYSRPTLGWVKVSTLCRYIDVCKSCSHPIVLPTAIVRSILIRTISLLDRALVKFGGALTTPRDHFARRSVSVSIICMPVISLPDIAPTTDTPEKRRNTQWRIFTNIFPRHYVKFRRGYILGTQLKISRQKL